jgi:exosortase A
LPARKSAGQGIPDYWRLPAVLTFLCLAVALIAFRETVHAMVTTWLSSRTFSHCILVFPLSGYMVWRRREQLAALRPQPNPFGIILLGTLGLAWLLGNIGEIRVLEEFSWIATLIAIIWTTLGTAVLRVLLFPLAFLFFAVPFGVSLIGPLQDVTAWFAVHALTWTGIPAVLEHRLLSVPSSTWTVAEACSGIRYLFSSVMVGVIYAWAVYRSQKRRLIFVLFSILVPVVANGFRAYGIVLLAYLSDNRLARNVDHIVYGWVFFSVVQLALFIVGLRWREPSSPDVPSPTPDPPSGFAAPFRRSSLAVVLAAVLILAGIPSVAQHLWERADLHSTESSWPYPPVAVSPPWKAVPSLETSWTPNLRNVNRDFLQSFVSGTNRIDLYWARFGQRGFELLSSYNRVVNPKSWSAISESQQEQIINAKRLKVRRTLFLSSQGARWIWTWYWVDGEFTSSAERVKFLQTKARLGGSSPTTIVFALSTESAQEDSDAEAVLKNFLLSASFLTPGPQHPEQLPIESVQDKSSSVHDLSR